MNPEGTFAATVVNTVMLTDTERAMLADPESPRSVDTERGRSVDTERGRSVDTERGRSVDTERGTLGRTAAWLAKQVEIGLGTVDLSLPQYRILGMLDERSAVSSDLAQQLAVRPPTITAVVDGLVAKGLVERRTVAGDRRRVGHVLTDQGHQMLDAADAAVDARLHEITDVLGDPAVTEVAFRGLAGWRTALVAYRTARWGR